MNFASEQWSGIVGIEGQHDVRDLEQLALRAGPAPFVERRQAQLALSDAAPGAAIGPRDAGLGQVSELTSVDPA